MVKRKNKYLLKIDSIKQWWKNNWFPFVMNITFLLQFGTGYLSEQKLQYYIILVTLIALWNMMYFITIPTREIIAYTQGKIDMLSELQKTFGTMKVENKKPKK